MSSHITRPQWWTELVRGERKRGIELEQTIKDMPRDREAIELFKKRAGRTDTAKIKAWKLSTLFTWTELIWRARVSG